jgi:hypothetical protein
MIERMAPVARYRVSGNLLASRDLIGLSKIGDYLAFWKKGTLIVETTLENNHISVKHACKNETRRAFKFLSYGSKQLIWRHEFLTGNLLLDIIKKKEV